MLVKICKCGRKIQQGKQCECQKQRHRKYNSECRDKIKNTFYHSKEWAKVSQLAKKRANCLDEYSLEYEHRLGIGNVIHHIFELDERPDLALSMKNLICVSTQTHAMIHAEYNRGRNSKTAMQQRLMRIRGKQQGGV